MKGKNDIQLLIDAISAPAVVIDGGRMLAANELGREMFPGEENLPQDIDLEDDESVQTEMVDGRAYAVTVKKLSRGHLAVFRDVEQGTAGRFLPVADAMSEPVNSLIMAAETLAEAVKDGSEELKRSTARIMKSQYILVRLMRGIKDTAELEQGEACLNLTNVILDELCGEICRECGELCGKYGVEIVFKNDSKGIVTALDEDKIRHMLLNLISNSVRACEGGGTVKVTADSDENNAYITVEDDGCGMSDDVFATAFTRFNDKFGAIPESERGMGMGLYYVSRAVQLHGGRVAISRGDERGTKVSVSIPLRRKLIFQSPAAKYARYPGFSQTMMELSGVLPYGAFMPEES